MACEREFLTKLIENNGLRATEARCRILELLYDTHEHYTPEEMLDALRDRGKPLSIATLYQNLQKLSEAGVIARFVGPDGHTRYDVNTKPHHHLVCKVCGRMLDVNVVGPLEELEPVPIFDSERSRASSWRVEEVHIELHGVCPECQARFERQVGD